VTEASNARSKFAAGAYVGSLEAPEQMGVFVYYLDVRQHIDWMTLQSPVVLNPAQTEIFDSCVGGTYWLLVVYTALFQQYMSHATCHCRLNSTTILA